MERDNRIILRLPMIAGHDCPVCNTFMSNYKPFTLFGGYTKEGVRRTGVYLLYCDQCNLFFAQRGQVEMIVKAKGFRPATFPAEGTGSEILEKAYSVPELQIRLGSSDGGTDLFSPKYLVFGEKRQSCLFCQINSCIFFVFFLHHVGIDVKLTMYVYAAETANPIWEENHGRLDYHR